MVLDVSHLNGSLVKSGKKWYNKTVEKRAAAIRRKGQKMAEMKENKGKSAREIAMEKAMCELGVMCGEDAELRLTVARAFMSYAQEPSKKATKTDKAWAYTIKHIKKKVIEDYLTPKQKEETEEEKMVRMMEEAWKKKQEEDKKKAEKEAKKSTKTEVKQ